MLLTRTLIFYMLPEWLHIGSMSGFIFCGSLNVNICILGVPVWRWSLGISTTMVVGSSLED
jgi:hypothetical protein